MPSGMQLKFGARSEVGNLSYSLSVIWACNMTDSAQDLFDRVRVAAADQQRSYAWYQKQVQRLRDRGSLRASGIMQTSQDNWVTRVMPGEMYLFYYDPKHADTLPYYDRLPLCLPYARTPDGFMGLNLHYLPYVMRFRMLGQLARFATDSNMNERTRLRLSWRLLQSSAQLAPVRACVRRYLSSQVQSRFLRINISDWTTASQLPIEQFVGGSRQNIWRQTQKLYR